MPTPLKILVPVKRVIDYAIKPRINATHTAIETTGIKHSMNPFDELSIEASVRIRERQERPVQEIIALSAGPTKCIDVLRTAMAMGADRSIHVEEEGEIEPLTVAKLLKKVVQDEGVNLCILGKQSIDDDANQTGQMLAGLLGWGQATQASKISFPSQDEDKVEVVREVDGGVETLRSTLPMVVTTDLRLNEPRYASLPNIMKAKKKRVDKKSLGDFGLEGCVGKGKRLRTVRVEEPPKREGGGKVEDVDGLIGRLRELGAI